MRKKKKRKKKKKMMTTPAAAATAAIATTRDADLVQNCPFPFRGILLPATTGVNKGRLARQAIAQQ